jgi:hypothetical protein
MFRLTKSETQLVVFVLSVIIAGATVKHFREKQRELRGVAASARPAAQAGTAATGHDD